MARKPLRQPAETTMEAGLPPAVRLLCLWFFLLPAIILWFVAAKSRSLSDEWAAYVPLLIAFAALALFLNRHPFWKLTHRVHIIATLAAASVLAFAMGLTGLLLLRFVSH